MSIRNNDLIVSAKIIKGFLTNNLTSEGRVDTMLSKEKCKMLSTTNITKTMTATAKFAAIAMFNKTWDNTM